VSHKEDLELTLLRAAHESIDKTVEAFDTEELFKHLDRARVFLQRALSVERDKLLIA
jgi:hypothetical protein